MGQRTQSVIEVTKPERNYETGEDAIKTYIGSYHNQWGIGKMQLWDIVRFLTEYVSGSEKYKLPAKLYKAWLLGKNDHPFKGEATPENVMEWMNGQDNNDGGFLLKVKMDRFGSIESGELYIFNDPECEEIRLTKLYPEKYQDSFPSVKIERVVSLLEYINYCPEYFNEEFLTMFTAMLRFFNIKLITPEM